MYELENNFFFADWSGKSLTHAPNVPVTAHQGFFTREAMAQIAHTTLHNLTCIEQERSPPDAVVVG